MVTSWLITDARASRRARSVSHAAISAIAWMPDDTVRSPAALSVRYVGGGNCFSFTKSGWWNVALVIDGKQGRDSVALDVVIPPAR